MQIKPFSVLKLCMFINEYHEGIHCFHLTNYMIIPTMALLEVVDLD